MIGAQTPEFSFEHEIDRVRAGEEGASFIEFPSRSTTTTPSAEALTSRKPQISPLTMTYCEDAFGHAVEINSDSNERPIRAAQGAHESQRPGGVAPTSGTQRV